MKIWHARNKRDESGETLWEVLLAAVLCFVIGPAMCLALAAIYSSVTVEILQ